MLKDNYTIKDYWPLILIFTLGVAAGVSGGVITADFMRGMTFFMGAVLVLLASLKIYNIKEFAMAFSTYDLLAGRSDFYAKSYPFLEFLLGVGYLLGLYLVAVNIVTCVVMTVGAVGVYQKMQDEEVIQCACLGAVFNVPMTWVTLVEDGLMAAMAAAMLVAVL